MLSYETLDSIADSVNPLLIVTTLLLPWIPGIKGKVRPSRWFTAFVGATVVVYGFMFVYKMRHLWSWWGGTYSTHSAVTIAIVALWFFASAVWFATGIVIFFLYAMLMVYQHYHTWSDILSTVVVVGPLVWIAGATLMGPHWRRQ